MSDKEKAIEMVKGLPDNKMVIVIAYLDKIYDSIDDVPNDKTITAMEENDRSVANGTAKRYRGSAHDIFAEAMRE